MGRAGELVFQEGRARLVQACVRGGLPPHISSLSLVGSILLSEQLLGHLFGLSLGLREDLLFGLGGVIAVHEALHDGLGAPRRQVSLR